MYVCMYIYICMTYICIYTYIYMETDTKWYSEQMWTDLNTSSNPPLRQDLRSVSQLVAVVSGWSGRLQRILQCLERGYTATTTGNSYTTFADEREFIYVDIYLLANIYGYGSNLHIYIYIHMDLLANRIFWRVPSLWFSQVTEKVVDGGDAVQKLGCSFYKRNKRCIFFLVDNSCISTLL